MKAIIFGASSYTSLGYYLGQYLKHTHGYDILYASRFGKLGIRCDINNSKKVITILSKEKPDIVINAAGVYSRPQVLGIFKEFDKAKSHILSKSFGALVLADAAAKVPSVKCIIMLGGREISSNAGFAAYSVGNGALWALVSFFANHHPATNIFYLDLPLIKNTTMGKHYSALKGNSDEQTAMQSVTRIIKKIIQGRYRSGSRIIIGKQFGL